jgi:ribonuclease PH
MEAVKANEITIERDYLSQSDGSCKLTQGTNFVIFSYYIN